MPRDESLKSTIASVFDRSSSTYDDVGVDFFTPFGRRLVELADLRAGERVLDVGCGAGAVLRPAAEAVGPTGQAIGLDLAPGMVRRAAESVVHLAHATARVGDAEQPDVADDSMDVVFAAFVLFFLPDAPGAVSSYARILRAGGRLAISSFSGEDVGWQPVFKALRSHVPPDRAPGELPGMHHFKNDETVTALLADAGFADVRHIVELTRVRFDDADHWLRFSRSHGMRGMWELVPAEHRQRAEDDVRAAIERLTQERGALVADTHVRHTLALRP